MSCPDPVPPGLPFFPPNCSSISGGSWLVGVGPIPFASEEPLNIVISGLSSPEVLTDDGFTNFANSIGFSHGCLGIDNGSTQTANLGDGNGFIPQTLLLREDYGVPDVGSCLDSLLGGTRFRVFRQNGTDAPTNALFLAVAIEDGTIEGGRTIASDGYDLGRDQVVLAAVGTTSFAGITYHTTAVTLHEVTASGSQGVNHNISIDGNTVLLTIEIII
ncbi:uncharacterized protein PHACADRAFT_153044 [Phanerochaete carnosa HHB-10118-sp]|uniref:Uncharacterized protein n=1 Tax=Phanerochaete carnosa (strain HHB-10118-sp) TaxID=650164 RepID=K5WKP4_PHACS|nr:uncharacterized protein PHACADRAFT_153044 [Phanerochaete carnosa HHB-10118-sp]EKM50802.1 hypothetical protein PHACADRAFT_153044 [Phanerochaete carnosa HHB-10118-sp]